MTPGLPPLIFCACKYTEPHTYQIQRNIHAATYYVQEVALLGGVPLCPAMIGANLEGVQSYLWWGDAYINLLRRCDAVFMVPGYERSNGATKELTEALAIGLPVFFELDDLKDWLDDKQQAVSLTKLSHGDPNTPVHTYVPTSDDDQESE
jgi:hypothetical protein